MWSEASYGKILLRIKFPVIAASEGASDMY